MPATGAIVAIAASQAAIAAHEAQVCNAKITISRFDSHTATIPQMQEYAQAVLLLHPISSPSDILWYKIVFVIVIIGAIGGLISASKDGYSDFISYFCSTIIGAIAGLVIGVIIMFGYQLFL